MDQIKIGKFIAESRKRKKLTQEQLAEKLGVNSRTISRWENGKNMPDISLYKSLCEILDISVEELINGEKTKDNYLKQSYEKAIINTIDSNEKVKKKMNKLIKLLLVLVFVISIITISIIIYYKNKYPKIDIYNIDIIKSEENKLNDKLTINKSNYNIFFYGINSLQIGDINNNYYDLKNTLKYNQITIKDIKNYLETQYNNENIERYILKDGGTKIYKSKKYEVIICNTLEGNKDIYFGTPNIEKNMQGTYCGKIQNDKCTFTRTYHILNITEDDHEDYINVTLKEFQLNQSLVRMKKKYKIEEGKNYEFTFSTYQTYDDTVENIFNNSTLLEVKETNKTGLNQTNEPICVNNN